MLYVVLGLLMAACSVPVLPPKPTVPPHVQAFADALCDRDAEFVSAHVAGRLAVTSGQLRPYFANAPKCSAARYIATDNGHYLIILTEGGDDVPYLLTFDGDLRVIDIK